MFQCNEIVHKIRANRTLEKCPTGSVLRVSFRFRSSEHDINYCILLSKLKTLNYRYMCYTNINLSTSRDNNNNNDNCPAVFTPSTVFCGWSHFTSDPDLGSTYGSLGQRFLNCILRNPGVP